MITAAPCAAQWVDNSLFGRFGVDHFVAALDQGSTCSVCFQFLSVAGDQANAMFVFLVFYFR